MNRKLAALLAAGVATVFTSTVTLAADSSRVPQVTVDYSDLDLSSQKGVDRLYTRLRTAARNVCGERATRDLSARAEARSCYVRALGDAVRDVNHVALTALHEGNTVERLARLGGRSNRS